ncbi:MAG: alpha/beta fold hydrolase [Deltaproteobacteria bacterium]|nr:alpha/beta fold hydrolase [Deltaproteobacteria bacterium]
MQPDSRPLYGALNTGLDLYRRGLFFEAHEIWEEVWIEEVGRTKRLLQVLIQIAAACHKHRTGNQVGTSKLLAKAVDGLEELEVGALAWLGFDLVALRIEANEALAASDARVRDPTVAFFPPSLPHPVGPDAVLYLHGFASSPRSFKAERIAAALAPLGIPFERPDLDEDDFEHLTPTRALKRARRCLHDRTLVVGSSFGGYIGALLAAQDERVASLILLAPAFGLQETLSELFGASAMMRWKDAGAAPVFHHAHQELRAIRYAFIEDAARHPAIPRARVPTQIIQGAHDSVVSLDRVRAFHNAGANANASASASANAAKPGLVRLTIVPDDHGLTATADEISRIVVETARTLGLASPPLTPSPPTAT